MLYTQRSKLVNWRSGKNTVHGVHKVFNVVAIEKKCIFALFNAAAESINCSLFSKNLEKHFCNLTC